MALWLRRDKSLFLDDNAEVLRGEIAWCQQFTFKWLWKKSVHVRTYIWEETQNKNGEMFIIGKFRWKVYGYALYWFHHSSA